EVLLVEPVDETELFNGIVIVEGRLRRRIDEVVVDTDAEGKFIHYPSSTEVRAWLVALHPKQGFALARQKGLEPAEPLVLRPWGILKGSITPDEQYVQSASVQSAVEA